MTQRIPLFSILDDNGYCHGEQLYFNSYSPVTVLRESPKENRVLIGANDDSDNSRTWFGWIDKDSLMNPWESETVSDTKDRLFIGIHCTGISYSDTQTEEHGDYKRLAFLPFSSLTLELRPDCPAQLAEEIKADANTVIAKRGERYEISTCGQYVTLGV